MIASRRGMNLLEVSVAGALLAVLLTVILQLFAATAARRRTAEDHQVALVEAANVMERLTARPWEELDPKTVETVPLSDEALAALVEPQLKITVTPSKEKPDARRIAVLLDWQDRSGNPQHPVRLVAWRYHLEVQDETRTR